MKVEIKNKEQIVRMRESNKALARVHEELAKCIQPGISTWEIDRICEELIRGCGGTPNFKNYEGFPASVCVSVNDEVVHGIPRKDRILKDGDLVSLDTGLVMNGFHSDAARTYAVGTVSPEVQKLMQVTKDSFFAGIKMAKAGNHLHDISRAIDAYVSEFGYGIVRELTGHGIGTKLHMEPTIPNYAPAGRGIKLVPGMTLAIEPMITLGEPEVMWTADNWTVVTGDGSWAAHYENTILITEGEPEILSLI